LLKSTNKKRQYDNLSLDIRRTDCFSPSAFLNLGGLFLPFSTAPQRNYRGESLLGDARSFAAIAGAKTTRGEMMKSSARLTTVARSKLPSWEKLAHLLMCTCL
jgi:hypothetical protein